MSIQRFFSVILFGTAAIGIAGSLSLDLIEKNNIGPGFMPLLYSALLLLCSVVLFFNDEKTERIRLKELFNKPSFDGVFFYAMTIAFYFLAGYLGMIVSLGVFGTTVLLQQNRMRRWHILTFEIVFLLVIYFVFTAVLRIPFETGSLFD